jgi:hypothetical protein
MRWPSPATWISVADARHALAPEQPGLNPPTVGRRYYHRADAMIEEMHVAEGTVRLDQHLSLFEANAFEMRLERVANLNRKRGQQVIAHVRLD